MANPLLQPSEYLASTLTRGREGTGFSKDTLARLAELRALSQEYKLGPIEQDRPGLFTRTIQFLSRPEYAIAGATEEVIKTGSILGALRRAGMEMIGRGQKEDWSKVLEDLGVGTITLGEIVPQLEGTWVGKAGLRGAAGLSLSIATDPITYIFSPYGVGAKIAAKSSIYRLTSLGRHTRSSLGLELRKALNAGTDIRTVLKSEGALKQADAVLEMFYKDEAIRAIRAGEDVPEYVAKKIDKDFIARLKDSDLQTLSLTTKESKELAFETMLDEEFVHAAEVAGKADKLFASRGIAFRAPLTGTSLGKRITGLEDPKIIFQFPTQPLYDGAKRLIGEPIWEAIKRMPDGVAKKVIDGGISFGLGARRSFNAAFNPYSMYSNDWVMKDGVLRQVARFDPEQRFRAIRMHRASMRASQAIRARMQNQVQELADEYRALEKVDPEIGQKIYSIREGTPVYHVTRTGEHTWDVKKGNQYKLSDLTEDQQKLYEKITTMADQMGNTLVELGIISREQLAKYKGRYFFHVYKNPEAVREFHEAKGGVFRRSLENDFTEKRWFETFQDAVENSKNQNAYSRDLAKADPTKYHAIEAVLEPDYDVINTMHKFADQYADSIGRKAWREQAALEFGIDPAKTDIHAIFNMSKPVGGLKRGESGIIESIFTGNAAGIAREVLDTFSKGGLHPEELRSKLRRIGYKNRGLFKKIDSYIHSFRPHHESLIKARSELSRLDSRVKKARTALSSRQIGSARAVEIQDFLIDSITKRRELKATIADSERSMAEITTEFMRTASKDIDRFAPVHKNLRTLERNYGLEWMDDGGASPKLMEKSKGGGEESMYRAINHAMQGLSANGRQELIRQLLYRVNSPAQWASLRLNLRPEWDKYFPDYLNRVVQTGDVDKVLQRIYGEGANYTFRKYGVFSEKGVHLPKVVVDEIEKLPFSVYTAPGWKHFKSLIRGYDTLNNWFKMGVYVMPVWTSSFVRDIYSSASFAALDVSLSAMNPRRARAAWKTLAAMSDPKIIDKLEAAGEAIIELGGVNYHIRDLTDMAATLGLRQSHRQIAQTIDDAGKVSIKARRMGKLGDAADNYMRIRADLGDNVHAVALWMANIDRGFTPMQAAERAREFIFDYNQLSQTERQLLKRFVPFYSFARLNIELQARQLLRNPGRALNQVKALRHRESDKEYMAKWDAEALGLRVSRNANEMTILNGIDLPMRNLNLLWNGGVRSTGRQAFGMVSPLLKTPLEVLTNRDLFTGLEITRLKGPTLGKMTENLPPMVKNWLGWKKDFDDAGRPVYTFDGVKYTLLVKSWAFSRFFSTSDRQFREYLKDGATTESVGAVITDLLTGLRTKRIVLTEAQTQLARIRIKQYVDELQRRGVVHDVEVPFKTVEGAQFQ